MLTEAERRKVMKQGSEVAFARSDVFKSKSDDGIHRGTTDKPPPTIPTIRIRLVHQSLYWIITGKLD